MGQPETALDLIGRAIRLKPDLVIAHNNLGNILRDVGRLDEAAAAIQEAIRLQPDYAVAHNNLGLVLKGLGRIDDSIESYRQAIRLQPDLSEAYSNLGNAILGRGGFNNEAIILHRHAIGLRPNYAPFHSDLLYALNYDPDCDAGMIYEEHRLWSQRHAEPLRQSIGPHINNRDPDRNLRIGYVSGDFRQHAVSHFFISLLENHDRGAFEIFCYANVPNPDGMTERMKRSCNVWRNIVGVSDEAVAQMVRADGIDILVDLSGHSGGHRPLVFAPPAPIQVSYLGYPNTTGMVAIDYRFTDALADPPGMTDHLNAEKLWRLPECAWCYQPLEDPPTIQPRGSGPITFGCFNSFAKVNPRIMAVWAELLRRVPGSRLLLKSVGGGEVSSRQRLSGQFVEHGVSGEQIEIVGWVNHPRQHLEHYQQVDVALDTFPYHGTTTTCEALWMGVPVVSMAGQTHLSRVGVSLLNCVGLPELIAESTEEYVSIAADLAKDLPRLAELRRTLRPRMQGSALMDAPRFTRNVEAAYRQMWRNWCAEPGNSTLPVPDRKMLQEQLESALSHHRAGRLTEAETLYRRILSHEPENVQALHRLGLIKTRRGESQRAIEFFTRAIAVDPNVAKYHSNLGAVLLEIGRFDEAMESFRKALMVSPDAVDAAVGLGTRSARGRPDRRSGCGISASTGDHPGGCRCEQHTGHRPERRRQGGGIAGGVPASAGNPRGFSRSAGEYRGGTGGTGPHSGG